VSDANEDELLDGLDEAAAAQVVAADLERGESLLAACRSAA
jgi:hypothetical protein